MTPEVDKLAIALEWVISIQRHYCKVVDGIEVRCRSIIEFAAYAKAEMAKRGWTLQYISGRVNHSVGLIDTGRDLDTLFHSFDPADPLSEARAIIKSCLEALELEA